MVGWVDKPCKGCGKVLPHCVETESKRWQCVAMVLIVATILSFVWVGNRWMAEKVESGEIQRINEWKGGKIDKVEVKRQ